MMRFSRFRLVIPTLALLAAMPLAALGQAENAASGASKKDNHPGPYRIDLPPHADFSALRWLMGGWAGRTIDSRTGKENDGSVHLTVAYVLDKRFLLFNEEVSLPAGKTTPAQHENWIGLLSPSASGQGFVLRTYSTTGFMSDYLVTVTDNELRCEPDGGPNPAPGWLFRRIITRLGDGYFGETVEAAPPGQAFFPYYTVKLTKDLEPTTVPPSAAPNSPPSPSAPAKPRL